MLILLKSLLPIWVSIAVEYHKRMAFFYHSWFMHTCDFEEETIAGMLSLHLHKSLASLLDFLEYFVISPCNSLF